MKSSRSPPLQKLRQISIRLVVALSISLMAIIFTLLIGLNLFGQQKFYIKVLSRTETTISIVENVSEDKNDTTTVSVVVRADESSHTTRILTEDMRVPFYMYPKTESIAYEIVQVSNCLCVNSVLLAPLNMHMIMWT